MKVMTKSEPCLQTLSLEIGKRYPEVSIYNADSVPVNCGQAIVAGEGLNAAELVSRFIDKSAKHWVQANEDWFELDLLQAGKFCESPESYFQSSSKEIAGATLASHLINLSSKDEKARFKQEISNFVQLTQSQNALDSAEIVAEELYMNAILDAPQEAKKLGFSNCKYEGSMTATMELSRSADRLTMTMLDPFGSLDCWKFIKRMDEVYKMGAGQVLNRGAGGAGLGCVIIFENCSSLFLGVQHKKLTQVSCVIPIGFSNKQRDKHLKSLHRIEV